MATLPTYEYAGAQYADLPKISTAPQQAAASGWSVLGQQLDKMAAFFHQEATTEAQKAGAKYALENPITQDQLLTAIGAKQPPKVPGAGTVFQESYLETQGAVLRSQLQTQLQNKITSYAAKIQAGLDVDIQAMREDLRSQTDGYAAALNQLSPHQSVQFRASAATNGSLLFKAATEFEIKKFVAQRDVELEKQVRESGPLIRLQFEAAGQIDSQTNKQVDFGMMIQNIMKPFYDAVKVNPDAKKYIVDMEKKIEKEAQQYLANLAMEKDFASNDISRGERVRKGDFGNKSIIYKSMSLDQQEGVQKLINERIDSLSKARQSFQANETFSANAIEKQIYATNDPKLMKSLLAQMNELAVDPSHIKRAREYIEHQINDGPKNDDLNTLATITRKMANGEATPQDVITASRQGKLTKASAKTLIMNIADPKDDIAFSFKVIDGAALIGREGAPPEIKDAEARSAAVLASQTSRLELMKYARTLRPDGTYPTAAEIRAEGLRLASEVRTLMSPMYERTLNDIESNVRMQLGKYGENLKIDDNASFDAAIAEATKNKVNQSSIAAAKAARDNYLSIKKSMGSSK